MVSHRLTQPVRSLSQGVEAIGMGGFGTLVEITLARGRLQCKVEGAEDAGGTGGGEEQP